MTRRLLLAVASVSIAAAAATAQPAATAPTRQQALDTMKRATTFMVETVSTHGGYVWAYLPDRSRRWGEMEAYDTMIWIQPPGTASMGHVFLDAFHATGDEYYYRAAEQVAGALIWGQHPSGGWNYIVDFAGDRSLRRWYATIGRNGWRLEEFQHYYGNATFDDVGTIESAKFLLRLYIEKRDPKYRPAVERAIDFVIDSQYPIGAWPQRFPLRHDFSHHGKPDYTSFLTFNDDVAEQNIDFLLMCYQVLGDPRVLDPVVRGMNAFLVTHVGAPQAGWSLQYTPDLKPVGARTYEPDSLHTGTTANNIELLMKFYRLTGETKFLARVPEALDWLDAVKLPAALAVSGRTHPTFVELGTNRPLYVHRRGSNVVNGEYYVDYDPAKTLAHYGGFLSIDVAALRKEYESLRTMTPEQAAGDSPLRPGAGLRPLPRYFVATGSRGAAARPPLADRASAAVATLNAEGYWLAPLGYNSHPYKGDGPATPPAGDFATTHVGDDSDTSPYPDPALMGISTAAYLRHVGALIQYLEEGQRR
jgi:PelA/Pel-15E family pectate lyase